MARRTQGPATQTQWRPGPIPHIVFDQPSLDFANSEITNHLRGGPGYDRMATLEWRRWFLKRWGYRAPLNPARATLARLARLRALMRSVLESHTPPTRGQLMFLNDLLASGPFVVRLVPGQQGIVGIQTESIKDGWEAVIASIVASFGQLISGELERVKRCGNPNCALIFYDDSVNRSRRWCDPRLCGNLVKVRRFRAQLGRPRRS